MNQELQFKLQAYLDGELPPGESKAVADTLKRDADARALFAELTHTRSALAGCDTGIRLPESREFYWSKIERAIALEKHRAPEGSSASIFTLLRRLAAPTGAIMALLLGALLVKQQLDFNPGFSAVETDTAVADSDAFTFRDYASGTTLVWLTYPAENEFAETHPADTIRPE
jgi:anti-sigma factor RsiW